MSEGATVRVQGCSVSPATSATPDVEGRERRRRRCSSGSQSTLSDSLLLLLQHNSRSTLTPVPAVVLSLARTARVSARQVLLPRCAAATAVSVWLLASYTADAAPALAAAVLVAPDARSRDSQSQSPAPAAAALACISPSEMHSMHRRREDSVSKARHTHTHIRSPPPESRASLGERSESDRQTDGRKRRRKGATRLISRLRCRR